MKQIAQDIIGELMETGKQTVKQAGAVPGQIVKSSQTKTAGAGVKKSGVNIGEKRTAQPAITDLAQPKNNSFSANDGLAQLIRDDNRQRQEGVDLARRQLAQLQIKRYREIQQKMQKEQREREGEIPEYIAGKPGAPRTQAEQLEMQEKQAKKAREQSNDPVLPAGPKSRGSLFFAKQRKGSSELKLGKDG